MSPCGDDFRECPVRLMHPCVILKVASMWSGYLSLGCILVIYWILVCRSPRGEICLRMPLFNDVGNVSFLMFECHSLDLYVDCGNAVSSWAAVLLAHFPIAYSVYPYVQNVKLYI